MAKLITAREAAELVQDGDAIICATFGASGVPEDIYMELEKRFLETGHPRSLTYTHAAGSGSFAALADKETGFCRGEDHICHTGMLKRWIASHSACSDFCAAQIANNEYAAWCLPLGTMIHMWREQARGLKGCLSKVVWEHTLTLVMMAALSTRKQKTSLMKAKLMLNTYLTSEAKNSSSIRDSTLM